MKEGIRTKNTNINVAVRADVSVVSVGPLCEDRDSTVSKLTACPDNTANAGNSIIISVLLRLSRGLCPNSKLVFPTHIR